MALIKPTYEQLRSKTYANLAGKLCPDQPFIAGGLIRIISDFIAYLAWALYEFSDRLGRTPWDAQGQLLYNYGLSCGISPLTETCARGAINIIGSGTIPEGTILVRCDGCEYRTTDEFIVPGNTVIVESINCGSVCNSPNGTILEFTNTPSGLESTTQVGNAGIVGGSDAEDDESFRLRVLSCLANPCRTGLASDYDYWARLHPGVSRVCVEPLADGCGTVKVYFTMDDVYLDGIPAQGDVDAVQEILENNVPLGVCATACAPTPVVIDVRIKLDRSGSTQSQRREIRDVLLEFFQSIECQTVCLADIIRAVGEVYDGCYEVCEPTDQQLNFGINEIPVLGTVRFANI